MMEMALKVLVMNGKQKKAITRRRLQESDYKKENQCGANDIDSWKETDTDVVVDEDNNNNNDIPPPPAPHKPSKLEEFESEIGIEKVKLKYPYLASEIINCQI
eukprot:703084_1